MITPLILSVPHALACMTLAVASIYWKRKRAAENKAYRFLFPFLIAAGIFGVTRIMFPIMAMVEVCVENGVRDVSSSYLSDWYSWILILAILLPVIPVFGMIPAIGRRPLLVGSLSLLAMLPSASVIYSQLIRNP